MGYLNIMVYRGGEVRMKVMLESYLLLNACMNAALLCIALRWSGRRIVPWRTVAASALGAVYAVVAYLPGMAVLRSAPCNIGMCGVMLFVAAKWCGFKAFARTWGLLYCATFLLGGIVHALLQAFGGLSPAWQLGILAGSWLGGLLLRNTQRTRQAAHAHLYICLGEASTRMEGLLDSGNLLQDPITGLPVIVAPYDAVRALLPKECDPNRLETLPPGFRLVQAVTAGGSRMLMCFHPTELILQDGGRYTPVQAMVAVSAQNPAEGPLALIPTILLST